MAAKKTTNKSKVQPASNTTPTVSGTSPVPDQAAANETAAMQEMIQLAKLEYLKSLKHKIVKEKRREIDSLDQQIKEFLGPYMLIGYDLNDQPVELISAESPTQYDALLERFRRIMYKINQNMVNSNGEDPYGSNRSE
jgi:hypothetical protein